MALRASEKQHTPAFDSSSEASSRRQPSSFSARARSDSQTKVPETNRPGSASVRQPPARPNYSQPSISKAKKAGMTRCI